MTTKKAQHTPGPWRALGLVVLVDDATVADCYSDPYEPSETEVGEANARLISAAPDLLVALRILVDNVETYTPEMIHDARAAIAKATGEGT